MDNKFMVIRYILFVEFYEKYNYLQFEPCQFNYIGYSGVIDTMFAW